MTGLDGLGVPTEADIAASISLDVDLQLYGLCVLARVPQERVTSLVSRLRDVLIEDVNRQLLEHGDALEGADEGVRNAIVQRAVAGHLSSEAPPIIERFVAGLRNP